MDNIKIIDGGVCAPIGFLANGIHCGIRKNKAALDLALIFSEEECDTAAVYTQNKVYGAPLSVTKNNIANGKAKAVICNSGIANTCNADGVEKAQATCEIVAQELNVYPSDIIVASTGVIGVPLNLDPIKAGMPSLVSGLSDSGASLAARAIMTTDTIKKEVAVEFELDGKVCKIGAMSKGSGMIHPNMATMLCFITTDVSISGAMLQKALSACVADSFNMLSIDGDTSTNDMVSVMANAMAGNTPIETENDAYALFVEALSLCCITLTKLMAKDGEGATKCLACTVQGAHDDRTAKTIAKSVICSSLVKTAMFGADANWGRILCAMGYSDADFDVARVDVAFSSDGGSIEVCQNGAGIAFSEDVAKKVLLCDEIEIVITLHEGDGKATAFGCDLTYDYVKINGDYRT